VKWFRKSTPSEFGSSELMLGDCYFYGKGVQQDYSEALRWYRDASGGGPCEAAFNVASMYEKGQGVPQDYDEAIKWYREAAEQGETRAQFNLGCMYENGRGVVQDYVQAHMWMNLAAAHSRDDDEKRCAAGRDSVATKMNSTQIGEAQRLARQWSMTHAKETLAKNSVPNTPDLPRGSGTKAHKESDWL